jgi:hypothetical protein
MLKPFDKLGVEYSFYKVDGELNPDIENIKKYINKSIKAILFIDYMGKSQKENIEPYQNLFKNAGLKIIQDCAQVIRMKADDLYGDYAFNSFRKILPIEGSILISKRPLDIKYARGVNFRFLFNKRIGQLIRYFHIKYCWFKSQSFLSFFERAESFYYPAKIFKLPWINKSLIKKIDLNELISRYRKYFDLLVNSFPKATLPRLRSVDYNPFGFFWVTPERDDLRRFLKQNGIFCPIHWVSPKQINKNIFPESFKVSKETMTIPLSDLNDHKANYLINCLKGDYHESIFKGV